MAKKKKKGFGLGALTGNESAEVFEDEVILDADAGMPDGSDARGHAELKAAASIPVPDDGRLTAFVHAPALKTVFKPHAESPYRNRNGTRRRGRTEIVPSSIPKPPAPPKEMGDSPKCTIIVVAQSQNKRNYQYSIVDVDDPKSIEGIGETRYESEVYPRGSWGHGWRKVVRVFGKLRNKQLGIPGNIGR